MGPEILVVGNEAAQQPFWNAIEDEGYDVVLCMEHELSGRLAQAPLPAVMVLSMDKTDYAAVLSQCRRHPDGAALPVILFAHAKGPIDNLADLIELGADQVLYAPVDEALFGQALIALAGPGEPRSPLNRPPRRSKTLLGPRGEARKASPRSAPSAFAESLSKHAPSEVVSEPLEPIFQENLVDEDTLDRLEDQALDALQAEEEQAIERDLAAFRLDDLPRIETEDQGFDPQDAEGDLFGKSKDAGRPERTSTHVGRKALTPPPPPVDPGGNTAEIPREDLPLRADLRPEDPKSSRGELALLARRLEQSGEPGVDAFGNETIRIQSRYSQEPQAPARPAAASAQLPPVLRGQTEGLLSQIEVPRLLWALCQARYDGVLDLSTAHDARLRIAWREGCIRSIRCSELGDSLPASLWRRLLLTKAQCDELSSIPCSAQVPETMIAHLLRRGWLAQDEQAFVLSRWIEDTVLRWWTVGSGQWKLTPDAGHWLCKEGRSNWDLSSVFLNACISQVTPALASLWLGERSFAPRLREQRMEGGLAPDAWLASRFGASTMQRQWLACASGQGLETLEASVGWQARYGGSSAGLCYALSVLGLVDLPEPTPLDPARSHIRLRERLSARLALALSGSYFDFLGLSAQASSAQAALAAQNLKDAIAAIEQDPAKLAHVEDLVLALKENLQAAQRVLGDDQARAMYQQAQREEEQ